MERMILNLIFDFYTRGVAQSGSALGSGPRRRRFKSGPPDEIDYDYWGYRRVKLST